MPKQFGHCVWRAHPKRKKGEEASVVGGADTQLGCTWHPSRLMQRALRGWNIAECPLEEEPPHPGGQLEGASGTSQRAEIHRTERDRHKQQHVLWKLEQGNRRGQWRRGRPREFTRHPTAISVERRCSRQTGSDLAATNFACESCTQTRSLPAEPPSESSGFGLKN